MITINWVTPQNLGTLVNGQVSYFSVLATASDRGPVTYSVIGTPNFPRCLYFDSTTGNLIGRVAFQSTGSNQSANQINTYSITVRATRSGQPSVFADRTFTYSTVQTITQPYDNIYIKLLPSSSVRSEISTLLNNSNVISPEYIYRQGDPYYGISSSLIYQHAFGLPNSLSCEYANATLENHYHKNIVMGELRTAVARDSENNIIYEVVYSAVIDDLVNSQGISISKEVNWPRVEYNRSTFYPASLSNMREQFGNVFGSFNRLETLPRWMTSQQLDGSILGYTPAVVLCYTKPGFGKIVADNINQNWQYKLNKYQFKIDRVIVDRSFSYQYYNDAVVTPPSNIAGFNTTTQRYTVSAMDSADEYIFVPQSIVSNVTPIPNCGTTPVPVIDPYYNSVVLLSNMYLGSPTTTITNSMVLYVDANNGYNPVLGNTSIAGNATVVDNNYYNFDGFSAINIQNSNLYDISWSSGKTVLVSAWFDNLIPYGFPQFRALLGHDGPSGSRIVNLYLWLQQGPGPAFLPEYRLVYSSGGYNTWSTALNVAPGNWNIFGFTHAPDATVKFYMNGEQISVEGTDAPGGVHPVTGFFPGNQYLGRADNYWVGRIGYWQVYNTTLTNGQILQNFNATKTRFNLNTSILDQSQYSNPSIIYYTGVQEFDSYLSASGGPIDNGSAWRCAYQSSGSASNRTVYYNSIPQYAMPGDFTIEAWIYNASNSLGENSYCLTGSADPFNPGSGPSWTIRTSSSGFVFTAVDLNDASNPGTPITLEGAAVALQWHHIAVTRSGNTVRMFVDGAVPVGTPVRNVVAGNTIPTYKISAVGALQIGGTPNTWMNTGDFLGPFRITVGVARYTASFTPPTTLFPTS